MLWCGGGRGALCRWALWCDTVMWGGQWSAVWVCRVGGRCGVRLWCGGGRGVRCRWALFSGAVAWGGQGQRLPCRWAWWCSGCCGCGEGSEVLAPEEHRGVSNLARNESHAAQCSRRVQRWVWRRWMVMG